LCSTPPPPPPHTRPPAVFCGRRPTPPDEVGKYLFDVLALAMNELQPGEREQAASFDRFRKVLYRHMDELADERNSIARKDVIDSRLLKTEIELYLAVSRY
ncbi:MAG: hypothetical protein OXQ29_23620, partial [Rhodospirillaceae bacterium]|nr:hypothetical protein [Rhodospirillaceae bacterium]